MLTRLAPPAQQARLLRRVRLEHQLAGALDYPLTLLVAPAGWGKTTAMASLATHGGWPAAWCRAHAADNAPLFVRHLTAAFRHVAALDEAWIFAALPDKPTGDVGPAVEALVNELAAALDDDTLLVVDDYHLADRHAELRGVLERFFAMLPLRLHVALLTREEPLLASVEPARLRGELLTLKADLLAFDPEDAREFWVLTGHKPPIDLEALVRTARGWPLAMQAVQGMTDWRAALGLRGPTSLDAYLANEVFEPLPLELRTFLLHNAGLRRLTPTVCALLADDGPPEPMLAELERRQFFVERDATGQLVFQPILRAFLERRARSELALWPTLQRRAADYYRRMGDIEGLMHHLLLVGDELAAAEALVEHGAELLAAEMAGHVVEWARRLAAVASEWPSLQEIHAVGLRKLGRYEDALRTFAAAEASYAASGDRAGQVRTLRGRAEVYLDTVQPAHATDLLKRALKLMPHHQASERAELLRMQSENWANRGRADVALILETAARRMLDHGNARPAPPSSTPPPDEPAPPRLLLRAGRLNEARQQLEAQIWSESAVGGGYHPGAHREPLLLLALIYAMLGSGTRALAMARRGLVESQQVGTPLTEAIAELRLGHAYQLVAPNDLTSALQRYAAAIDLIHTVGVTRTRAEGYMGLTLLYGHAGDLPRAEADAREGLQIAAVAGDEWIAALILLALGGAAVAGGDPRAGEWLEQARQRFARGGDTYGLALTNLWRAIAALRGSGGNTDAEIGQLLDSVVAHGYSGILVAPSLFGPRDMASLVPLLLRGRSIKGHSELARLLLRQGFPTIAADDTVDDYHPGYTLRVQMFGTFRVWRGAQEIQAREWQREKARQLFQLLLTYRGHWVQREQICAWLWPEADLEAAERQFKVTLNALNAALEPGRPPRVAPFFVRRQGLAYSFAPSYGVWIDVDEFELRAAAAATSDEPDFARRNAQIAVNLYRGDYLAESLYDAWTTEERERLTARYLATAVAYANRLSQEGDQAQAIQLCEQVLKRDRCYEEAYQVLIHAHARAGSRSQALRSYARCAQALRDELAMEPLPETDALYEALKRNEAV
ncbi:BTAD domain-containing putative transcriptional regulator [Candidatus Viridilinea mediisalina]|uniref:BTAD domain-containing putative transcriptional regulator n=1 Tax=Candidatus Viridilinea mediisalina TaxID=2024553 RepID=UPI001FEC0EE1|nr:BTAD domain-containing putative transcriptional regulator [Candidatus Viridilinea mediisalina]